MMVQTLRLAEIRALIIDIDGTLFRGALPLPGIVEFFAFLRRRGIAHVVVSNNARKSPAHYLARLAGSGVSIGSQSLLTSAQVATAYLEHELEKGAAVYVIGEPPLHDALRSAGFSLQEDARQPVAAVVVGGDSTLTYAKLKHAALLLQQGARLVGTNPDLLCPSEEGLVPEAGTTLAALQAATGVTPIVMGKPEQYLFDLAVERLGSARSATAIVGDRLETDIVGGQRAGLRTILVTTGVDNEATIRHKGIQPDLVVSGLDALVDIWQSCVRPPDQA